MLATRFSALRSKITNIQTTLTEKVQLPEKFKGTVIERWGIYWKSLANDYTDVAVGAAKTAKEKPLRTSILGAIGLGTYLCGKNNPDNVSFMQEIRNRNGDMMMVHESCQRAESAEYLKLLETSMNHGTLRILNLGVFTIVWLHDYSKDLCTYKAICSHLQPDYTKFHERIIDVGFWNKWWNLDRKMIDYDIVE